MANGKCTKRAEILGASFSKASLKSRPVIVCSEHAPNVMISNELQRHLVWGLDNGDGPAGGDGWSGKRVLAEGRGGQRPYIRETVHLGRHQNSPLKAAEGR